MNSQMKWARMDDDRLHVHRETGPRRGKIMLQMARLHPEDKDYRTVSHDRKQAYRVATPNSESGPSWTLLVHHN